MFGGLNMNMGTLPLLSNAVTRSISPENFTGAKGAGGMCKLEDGIAKEAARELGTKWKVNPYIRISSKETFILADIEGQEQSSIFG